MVSAINSFLTSLFVRYTSDEDGQTMAEYGIILALVAVIAMVAFTFLQGGITGTLNTVGAALGAT